MASTIISLSFSDLWIGFQQLWTLLDGRLLVSCWSVLCCAPITQYPSSKQGTLSCFESLTHLLSSHPKRLFSADGKIYWKHFYTAGPVFTHRSVIADTISSCISTAGIDTVSTSSQPAADEQCTTEGVRHGKFIQRRHVSWARPTRISQTHIVFTAGARHERQPMGKSGSQCGPR